MSNDLAFFLSKPVGSILKIGEILFCLYIPGNLPCGGDIDLCFSLMWNNTEDNLGGKSCTFMMGSVRFFWIIPSANLSWLLIVILAKLLRLSTSSTWTCKPFW